MTSPTFVCQFSDGVLTRMTTHCTPDNLDLRRGIVLSRIAYRSRTKGKRAPPITEARFETLNGAVLHEYDEASISGATVQIHNGRSTAASPISELENDPTG